MVPWDREVKGEDQEEKPRDRQVLRRGETRDIGCKMKQDAGYVIHRSPDVLSIGCRPPLRLIEDKGGEGMAN